MKLLYYYKKVTYPVLNLKEHIKNTTDRYRKHHIEHYGRADEWFVNKLAMEQVERDMKTSGKTVKVIASCPDIQKEKVQSQPDFIKWLSPREIHYSGV